MPEVAEIFRRYGDRYRRQHGASLSTAQRRVITAIVRCRTAALGGHVEQCDACGHQRISYNSCRNRHCPKCQSLARARWLEERRSELLPTPYFHLVFTLPAAVADIALQNKAVVYDILFRTTAETLRTIKAFDAGKLTFCGTPEALRERGAFLRQLAPARKAEWVVYAKPPFAGPEQVLAYVARYTHRIAISNDRLIGIEDDTVRFRWRDYCNGNRQRTMAFAADEFIRRFLLHVLPQGFQRIRYYGFLGNRYRDEKLARCRQLLAVPQPPACEETRDYRAKYQEITGASLIECPACHRGNMLVIDVLSPTEPASPIWDSS